MLLVYKLKKLYYLFIVITLIFLAWLFTLIHNAIITPRPDVSLPYSYKLSFDDEFNEPSLDFSAWSTCYRWYSSSSKGCTNFGNNEDEWYTPTNVSLRQGDLYLSADRSTYTAIDKTGSPHTYSYHSGMITTGSLNSTSAKWQGLYGYYEAKIWVPTGQATWPAFWLLPSNGQWPPEIDIMEVLGSNPRNLLTTFFWSNSGMTAQKNSATYTATASLSAGWHHYGVLWQKGSLTWYLDGKKIRSVVSTDVPSVPMVIVLNLAMGGSLPGQVTTTSPPHALMKVDYIRVYQQK